MYWLLPLLSLLLLLALNWQRFQAMPKGEIVRMVLIWAVIIVALTLVVRLLGLG